MRLLPSLLLSSLLAQAMPGLGDGFMAPAQLVPGAGIRLLELDGELAPGARWELEPGPHTLRFESTATVESLPGRRSRVIREICDARFHARQGALYALVQEVIASRGVRSWHHQLSSFIHDEGRDRATGECVCRTAPPS